MISSIIWVVFLLITQRVATLSVKTSISNKGIMDHSSNSNGQIFVCTNKWCREKGSDATVCSGFIF